MFRAGTSPHLAFLADSRLASDAALDDAEPDNAPHVLDWYKVGKLALGPHDYQQAQRIALFNKNATPDADERALAREQLRGLNASVTVLLPTAKQDEDGAAQTASTHSWPAFNSPDGIEEMRGTFFEWAPGQYVMPVFPNSPYLKQLQYWQQRQWIQRAWQVARGRVQLLHCSDKFIYVGMRMLDALRSLAGKPLAVDIESIESTGLITAIGLSDGEIAVSVPFDAYLPYGHTQIERALYSYDLGRDVRLLLASLLAADTPKAFHNHTFDVPRLKQKYLPIGGPIHDTIAAHGIAYPELRHGLQHACASLLPVTPWKSMWHPKLKGITRDDIEFWICDPIGLRLYNANDAFHTWHLAKAVLPHVQVKDFG